MNKQETNKLVPQLRFPEFRNKQSWNIKPLGNISEIVRGGSPRPIQEFITTDEDGLNWLKIADVATDAKYISYTKERVIKEAITYTREVNSGDLILSNSMSFGRPYILKIKSCIHDGWIAIRNISNETFENYLYYYISSDFSQNYFQVNAAGAAVKNLNAEIIKILPVFLPVDKKEQQKIADCLSSLDEVINAQSQKIDTLKNHKKGLLQNLFPTDGEMVPKMRFKEFGNYGYWEEKTLEQIATFLKGKGISKADISQDGVLPCIRYGELYTQYKETINSVISYTNLPKEELILSQANDVIIPASGETQEDIATASCVMINGIALGGDLNIIRTDVNGVFLSYFLNNAKKKEIAQLAQGISVVHLYSSQLKNLKINIPQPIEQKKIADCLSSLDNQIEAETKRLEELKNHKKGLMQQLFPTINQ